LGKSQTSQLQKTLLDAAKKSVFLMVVLYVISIAMSFLGSIAGLSQLSSLIVSFNFFENLLGYFITFGVGFVLLDYVKKKKLLPSVKGYMRNVVEAIAFLVLLYGAGFVLNMFGFSQLLVSLGIVQNVLGYLITFVLAFIGLDYLEKEVL